MRSKRTGVHTVTNRVKELREARAWTKAELARRAGIASQTLNRIEGSLSTRKDRRLAVAKALEKPYEQVFPNNHD